MTIDFWPRFHDSVTGKFSVLTSIFLSIVCVTGCDTKETSFEGFLIDSSDFVPISISEDGKLLESPADVGQQPVSADGRYVTFEAWVKNASQIFLVDNVTNISKIISKSDSKELGNRSSFSPVIDDLGGSIIFLSFATNLAGGDGQLGPRVEPPLAYRYDIRDGKLDNLEFSFESLLSLSGDGQTLCAKHNGIPRCMALSGSWSWDVFSWLTSKVDDYWYSLPAPNIDGSVVVFTTDRSLTPDDVNDRMDVYLVDTKRAGGIQRISVGQHNVACDSYRPAISSDGNFVAFLSCPALGDPNLSTDSYTYFLFNRSQNTIKRLPSNDPDFQGWTGNNYADQFAPSISDDGRFVALVWAMEGTAHVVVWDTQTDSIERVVPDELIGHGDDYWRPAFPRITPDGKMILFGACSGYWCSLYMTNNPHL